MSGIVGVGVAWGSRVVGAVVVVGTRFICGGGCSSAPARSPRKRMLVVLVLQNTKQKQQSARDNQMLCG